MQGNVSAGFILTNKQRVTTNCKLKIALSSMARKDASVDLVSILDRYHGRLRLNIRLVQLPEDACSFSVTLKAKNGIDLTPVKPVDSVV